MAGQKALSLQGGRIAEIEISPGAPPTAVDANSVFQVRANTQVLIAVPIDVPANSGVDIEGALIEVN